MSHYNYIAQFLLRTRITNNSWARLYSVVNTGLCIPTLIWPSNNALNERRTDCSAVYGTQETALAERLDVGA